MQGECNHCENSDHKKNSNDYNDGIFIVFFVNFYILLIAPYQGNYKGDSKKNSKINLTLTKHIKCVYLTSNIIKISIEINL